MDSALAIAHVLSPLYLMLGLSILLYTKVWQRVIEKWEEDHLPLFTLMFFYAVFGLVIVNSYNVWAWNVWLLVTLTGWVMLVKSVFYFLLPGTLIKKCLNFKKKLWVLYVAGVLGVVLGLVLGYYAYFA